ncbi:transglycosylase domain-containing protein [Candidatus Kaiserbacteria bacterium]|nr:transglycosylase domain-containing protein [Candidatus Kaiserbacteria bacterium]
MIRKIRKLWRKMPAWMELSLVAMAAFFLIALGSAVVWATLTPIPAIDNFENRKVAESTKIFDRTGNIVLFDVYGQIRRTSVPLEEISPYIQKATIAIEDTEFYNHRGFRPLSFARALLANLKSGSFSQGGSTITQQVVKNALLTQRKTIGRKLEEIILALRLERAYTKEQILQTYLNETSYGGTIYGVQEASQYFFGVDAKDIDLAQAAYLAALPQAPTRYSPYGSHRDLLDARQKLVLRRLLDEKLITEEEYEQAAEEAVTFRGGQTAGIKAPHFVFFIREYLEEKYGADTVAQGGLRVVTTLDWELQEKAEEVVKKHAPSMERNFNAGNEGVVAIEPSTGQILAMVGSRDYFEEKIDGAVNVTTSFQQPGSAFKPFVYATALERGYTPETVVFDLQTQFSTACSPQEVTNSTPPCYAPTSFDNTFKGPVTFREALAQSLNIPGVKTLYLVGVENALKMAERVGITTLGNAAGYGLTLVLGGGDVTPLELTGAYAVLANDGVKNPPTGILRVEDREGNVLEEYEEQSERVMEAQIARQISDILADNVARTPEFGANSPLYFPGYDVAAKTGTTNDYWDVWILGYTPSIAIGAWAGNNDNTPMEKRIAAFIIAPMWHEIMAFALETYPAESFTPPAPENDEALPPVLRGNWNTDPSQGVHEILYWVDKDNPRSGRTSNRSDRQFLYWEYPLSLWGASLGAPNAPPLGFIITSPPNTGVVRAFEPFTLSAMHPHPELVERVSYYLNGGYVGASVQAPYALTLVPEGTGAMQLTAVAETALGAETSTIMFTIQ